MKNYTYHFEARNALKMFSDAFDDVVIKRYNKDRESEDQIHVTFKYAPKTRVITDLVQKDQHIKLPVIAITVASITRDQSRVVNKIDGSYYTDVPSGSAITILPQPVPVTMTVNMSILGRFQSDIDQILTNFIPYCDPYVVISMRWPEEINWADLELRNIVKWDETISFEYPTDISNTAPYRIGANTTFKIDTWMFKNSPPDGKPIHIIDMSFASVSAIDDYDFMESVEYDGNTDYFTISARPQFYDAYPTLTFTDAPRDIICHGSMMDFTDTLYLSSNNVSMFPFTSGIKWDDDGTTMVSSVSTNPATFDLYGDRTMVIQVSGTNETVPMSSQYPPFYGYKVDEFSKTENMLKFTNTFEESGFCDVVAANEAGYGLLTVDAVRERVNPYIAGSPEYDRYSEIQFPVISGIQVEAI